MTEDQTETRREFIRKVPERSFKGAIAIRVALATISGAMAEFLMACAKEQKEVFVYQGKIVIPSDTNLRSEPRAGSGQEFYLNITKPGGKHEEITLENPQIVVGGSVYHIRGEGGKQYIDPVTQRFTDELWVVVPLSDGSVNYASWRETQKEGRGEIIKAQVIKDEKGKLTGYRTERGQPLSLGTVSYTGGS